MKILIAVAIVSLLFFFLPFLYRRSIVERRVQKMKNDPEETFYSSSSYFCFLLEAMAILSSSGSSLPRTLKVVGSEGLNDRYGEIFCRVAYLLESGCRWDTAWDDSIVLLCRSQNSLFSRFTRKNCMPAISCLKGHNKAWYFADMKMSAQVRTLQWATESTWSKGAPLCRRLTSLSQNKMEEVDKAISEEASRMTVRLLIPLGICFLPAFIFIGIIPLVGSFIPWGI